MMPVLLYEVITSSIASSKVGIVNILSYNDVREAKRYTIYKIQNKIS